MKTEMLRFQASILPTSEHVHCAGGVWKGAPRSLRAVVVIIENPPTNPTRCHQILTGGSLSGANNSQRQPSPHLSTDAQYRDLLYWSPTVQRLGVLESQYRELLYWNEPHSTETESNLWKQNHRRSQVVRGAPPPSPHLLQLQRGK